MELKDQQAKNETVDQQVQAGETLHQQGVHVHCYGTATYYNDCITVRRIGSFWILRAFKIKFQTNSAEWSNAMMILLYHQ